jgi:beta-lactamase class A
MVGRFAVVLTLATFACGLQALFAQCARAADVPGPLESLQLRLAVASAHAPGHVALEIKDLATGYATAVNAGANMPAASVIKIPVMVEVFEQMAEGRFDLNKTVRLKGTDRDWGWGDLADARSGKGYTVARLLRLMITESDNTATNMLIRLVGRSRINATMHDLGLRNTHLGEDIRSDGNIRSLRTSPRDMVRLLEALARAKLVDPWSSREMLDILAGQRHNGLIPQPLPKDLQIAHKTGTLHDTLNDVGIVFLADEPYVIAVMTTHLPSLDLGRRFIRGVSWMAYASFERFAQWRTSAGLPAFGPEQQTPLAQPGSPDVPMWSTPSNGDAAPAPPPTEDETPAPSETDSPAR